MTYITKRQRVELRKKKTKKIAIALVAIAVFFVMVFFIRNLNSSKIKINGVRIPEFSGEPYCVVNDNKPFFGTRDLKKDTFESYSKLDKLGRCGVAFANVSRELMPVEEREGIGNIKPSGWNQAKYKGIVNSKPPFLYNRCHLIAYCLTAENANEQNLITGTRYMNIEGMLPFEKQVAVYLDEHDNHVLYRSTPVFIGDNLVADGVLIEAYSIEDKGEGVSICVYCYNVQPGVKINYKTGESRLE